MIERPGSTENGWATGPMAGGGRGWPHVHQRSFAAAVAIGVLKIRSHSLKTKLLVIESAADP
jgi:hypothetical protein